MEVKALPESTARCATKASERNAQQHDAERGGPSWIELRADHREEDLGRQHAEVSAEQDGIAEVGDRLDEADEERIGKARIHERQRNVAERPPAIGAQRLRRFLERGRHAFDDAHEHEEGDRREREHLRDEDALHAVDPARRLDPEGPLEELVHDARSARRAG